ncbi:hypothetical protein [Geitlerinema sp. PCC 9228]|uniref:hypothetical protein n=1 Tax=Geitlerinema sp. PCC 9228 TaxID=111611 RepID=UPI001114A4FA|nr:hypothetical protein [Geitlerinema sp. PCC 9228]
MPDICVFNRAKNIRESIKVRTKRLRQLVRIASQLAVGCKTNHHFSIADARKFPLAGWNPAVPHSKNY